MSFVASEIFITKDYSSVATNIINVSHPNQDSYFGNIQILTFFLFYYLQIVFITFFKQIYIFISTIWAKFIHH